MGNIVNKCRCSFQISFVFSEFYPNPLRYPRARAWTGLLVIGCRSPAVPIRGAGEMVVRAQEVGRDEVALVVGGFHLGRASPQRIEEIIGEFRRLGVLKVAPCYCTGCQARELFQGVYGRASYTCGVGWQGKDQRLMSRAAEGGELGLEMLLDGQIVTLTGIQNQKHLDLPRTWISPAVG
jgi:hypothetical protein